MKFLSRLTGALLLACALTLQAGVQPYTFEDPDQEEQFKTLTEELRCLVCQNQSLADSNAGLAQDLRREVFNMVEAGNNNQEVVDFMVSRYGDFVLYRPPVRPATYLLWLGPLLLLLTGVLVLGIWVRGRARGSEAPLSSNEQARLNSLIGNKENTSHDD